jgi:hypothetical protein
MVDKIIQAVGPQIINLKPKLDNNSLLNVTI